MGSSGRHGQYLLPKWWYLQAPRVNRERPLRKPVGFDAITTQKADYQTPAKGSERCRRPKAVLVEGAPLSNVTTYRSAAYLRCLAGCQLYLLDNAAWLGNSRIRPLLSICATGKDQRPAMWPLPSLSRLPHPLRRRAASPHARQDEAAQTSPRLTSAHLAKPWPCSQSLLFLQGAV